MSTICPVDSFTFSSGRSCQSQPGLFGMCLHLMRFSLFISFDMWSLNESVLPLIFFWNHETGSLPYCIVGLLAPFSTGGRSPTVSLTVIDRKGAPAAVLLTAA
uniref:Dmt101 n=1 Tax=Arundo donax TaxID=35708 RepID=A0A0A9FUG7_ARUDO